MSAKILNALAEEYGFDAKKAKEFLIEKGIVKAPKKRQATPKAEKSVTKKADKNEDDEDKPKTKRPIIGYNIYRVTERPNIKAELVSEAEGTGKEMTYTFVTKAVNDRWKALSNDEKKIWNDKAKAFNDSNSESDSTSKTEETDVKEKNGVEENEQTEEPEE